MVSGSLRRWAVTLLVLVLVTAGLMGLARWRLATQTSDATVWSARVGLRDTIGDSHVFVAGPNAFVVKDDWAGYAVVRLRDGHVLRREHMPESIPYLIKIKAGTDGSFVVYHDRVKAPTSDYTYYGPDGRARWRQRLPEGSEVMAIDSGLVMLFTCRTAGRCELRGVGPRGEVRWHRALASRDTMLWPYVTPRKHSGEGSWDLVVVPEAVVHGNTTTIELLDGAGRDVGEPSPWDQTFLEGRRLYSLTVRHGDCLLRTAAQRSSWRLPVRCRGTRLSPYAAQGSTLYAWAHARGKADRLLAVDLRRHRARFLRQTPHGWDWRTASEVQVGDRVVLSQRGSRLTATSASTGRELWHDRFGWGAPRAVLTRDTVAVEREVRPWWGWLAVGAHVPQSQVELIDATTGDRYALLRVGQLDDVAQVGRRSAVVLADGRLSLVRH